MLSKKLFLSSITFFVLASLPFIGSVGASSEMWSQTYGGVERDVANSVVETSDGGYALTGDGSLFVKTDEHGNVEWTKTYEGTSLVETSDGGYAIAGYTWSYSAGASDFWLVKTDAQGNMEWNKTYGGADSDHAYSLVETPDGGYALAGYTYSFGAGRNDFWLVKTDRYGNMEWNKTYGGAGFDRASSLVVTSDGGFAIAGGVNGMDNYAEEDFWLIKTDSCGNMEWNKTYSKEVDQAYCVIETTDGGFVLAGSTGFWSITDIWVVKTDEYGNMEWNKTYGDGVARALVESSDGGYVLAGNNRLIKTDAYGNIVWSRTYDVDTVNSVIKTSDGGYALAGTKHNDFWLAKTDEYGVIPEFPSWASLLIVVVAVVVVAVVYRYNLKKLRGWVAA